MAKIEGVSQLLRTLKARSLKGRKYAEYEVGYSAPYAIYVHEDLTAQHPRGGQAKYLEQPAREHEEEIGETIKQELLRKRSMEAAALKGAQKLLSLSLPLVPVDTGFLKSTGYVRTWNGAMAVTGENQDSLPPPGGIEIVEGEE